MRTIIAILAVLMLASGAQAALINHVTVDTGAVRINNPANDPVKTTCTGSVYVLNYPATQAVSGTVAISSMPEVSVTLDSVTVSTAPSEYTDSITARIDGTVTAALADTVVTVGDTVGVNGQVGILGSVGVTGTFWQDTQPVSVADTIGVRGQVGVSNWPAVQACTLPAATSTGSCTSTGGLTAVLCDLGDTYEWIYVTCPDSAVVGFVAATNIGSGDQVDRVMVYNYRTRYVWVCSEVAYAGGARCIRVRGMK